MKRFLIIKIVLPMLFGVSSAIASESEVAIIQITTHLESDGGSSWSPSN